MPALAQRVGSMPVGTVKWFDPTRATASSSLSPVTTYSSTSAPSKKVAGWREEGQAVVFEITEGRKGPRPPTCDRSPPDSHSPYLQDYRELAGQRRAAHNTSACGMEADPVRLNRRPREPTAATGELPGRPAGPGRRTGGHREPVERKSG